MLLQVDVHIPFYLIIMALLIYAGYGVFMLIRKNGIRSWLSFILWSIGWLGIFLLVIKPEVSTTTDSKPVLLHNVNSAIPDQYESIDAFTSFRELLLSDLVDVSDSIFVMDHFLTPEDLDLLKGKKIEYADDPSIGFTEINYTEAYEGNLFALKGNVTPGAFDLINIEYNGSDVGRNSPDSSGTFNIETRFQAAGDYLVNVSAFNNQDTISHPLHIHVRQLDPLKFLMISRYPTFEMNYIRTFLADQGHQVASRSKISESKYLSNYSNIDRLNLNNITPTLLNRFNGIIMPVDQWNNIGNTTRENILNHVYEDGASLIILPETGYQAKNIPYHEFLDYSLKEIKGQVQSYEFNLHTLRKGSGWRNITYLNTEVGAAVDHGTGTISIIGMSNTYPILLSGAEDLYKRLWSNTFSSIISQFVKGSDIIIPKMLWSGSHSEIQYLNQEEQQHALLLNNEEIPIRYLPFTEMNAIGSIYPTQGWNVISNPITGQHKKFYTYSHQDWPLIHLNKAKKAAEQHNLNNIKDGVQFTETSHPISYLWGLSLFILGMCGLWLKERLGN